MARNRLVPALALCLTWTCLASGSSIAQPVEKVLNWTAPPYWMPIKVQPLDKRAEVGLSPEAVEGVPTAPLAFTGITPCRVADTRGNGFSGEFGPPQITPAGRTITIANSCGIPASAEAVSFNFSALNIPGAGFLVAYPAGAAFPAAATMTYNQNTPNLSNAAVVPLGTAGAITVVAGVVSVDLVIDVNGYYAPQPVVHSLNLLSGPVTLLAGTNISITPSGQTLTIANTAPTAPAAWQLTGNAGTTPGTNFLGTTDNQPLEIKVNNQRIFRLEPNSTSPRVIGGHPDNNALAGVLGATIGGGGGAAGLANVVTDYYGTVGGGRANRAGNNAGTLFDSGNATVSGGTDNIASAQTSFVGGGQGNIASGQSSTVGGGQGNNASGSVATIPGGNQNTAAGMGSFAAGTFAQANHSGAFVWADNASAFALSSTGINQFIVRATGGIWLGTNNVTSFDIATDFLRTSTGAHLTIGGIWTNASDRALKENFHEVDRREVLSRVAALPLSSWNYKAEGTRTRHLGPTAQDFAAAFGLGGDNRSIGTVDADGVALAAIQGLYEEVQQLRKRVAELEAAKN